MAYNADGLRVIAHGGALGTGPGNVAKIYHYITNDADTVVETDAYFDTTDMNKGDVVHASVDIDGTPEYKCYIVSVGTGDATSNDVTVVPFLIA
jgi:hypothetical protein